MTAPRPCNLDQPWRERIAGEYREMPGLKLRGLLEELCERQVLVRTSDGAYRLP